MGLRDWLRSCIGLWARGREAVTTDVPVVEESEPDDECTRPTADDLGFQGITSRYMDDPGVSIDESKVPENLRHLIPYAMTWCIGDDVERGDLMWLTPREELTEFVAAVWPRCSEINQWCRSHDGDVPVPDEVIIFGMMTEAATEAVACFTDEPPAKP